MQSRNAHGVGGAGPLYQLLRCASGADFVRLVEKLGFQPVLLPFSQMAKPSISKAFLIVLRRRRKDGGFPQPYGEAGDANGGRRSALVLCYRDEYKLALGEERGSLTSYWRMNGWQAHLTHSQCYSQR